MPIGQVVNGSFVRMIDSRRLAQAVVDFFGADVGDKTRGRWVSEREDEVRIRLMEEGEGVRAEVGDTGRGCSIAISRWWRRRLRSWEEGVVFVA